MTNSISTVRHLSEFSSLQDSVDAVERNMKIKDGNNKCGYQIEVALFCSGCSTTLLIRRQGGTVVRLFTAIISSNLWSDFMLKE